LAHGWSKFKRDQRPLDPNGLLAAIADFRQANNLKDEKFCFQTKRHEVLTQLIALRLELLNTYPADSTGLLKSAKWPENLHAEFGPYEDSTIFADAMQHYRKSRNRLLIDALPRFEAAVVQQGGDIEKLRRQYFPGKMMPICLCLFSTCSRRSLPVIDKAAG
jgi:hypothetical protein